MRDSAMRRRLLLAAGAGMLAPGAALARDTGKYRLGVLNTSAAVLREPHWIAFFRHLGELGLVEGGNLTIERRHPKDGRLEELPAAAAELAKQKCDVFFTGGPEATLTALTQGTRSTPIVVIAVDYDPVGSGDVASLGRTGGRVTGVTAMQSTMPAKRLELLKEMLPHVRKVVVFTNVQTVEQLSVTQEASRRLGLELQVVDFKEPPFDYPAGFAAATRAKADALFVLGSGLWVPARRALVDFALKARLASVFHHSGWTEAGGLMSYGFSFPAMWRRGAEMVATILRGTNAASMPMEQPTGFELAINMRTAQALGLTIPQSILVRADRVFD